MTGAIAFKLLAIYAIVATGWLAGRRRWLGVDTGDAARVLSNVTFYLFVPALLFRTMAKLDIASLPGRTLAAYFVPALAFGLAVYAWQRRRIGELGPAGPASRTVTALYGNAVQLGIPMAAALFGAGGLAIHLALVSLHGLVLLTALTVLAEMDLARADPGATLRRTVVTTARNAIIHPVVLPILAGMAWNLTGLGLHPAVDETLGTLGTAVVPVCLVLIGLTLAQYGVRGHVQGALALGALKLLGLPAVVLVVAHWGFGLTGLPLAVLVLMAGLPSGSNVLIFAQRYDTRAGEATAAIVLTTVAFIATVPLWLAVLGWLNG